MKKVLIIAVSLLLVFTVGCSFKKGQSTNNPNISSNGTNTVQKQTTPESTLRRSIMEIQRLQSGTLPLTAEQKSKLILILNDIKGQTTISEEYAAAKATEINNVLTAEQKESLTKRQNQQGAQNGQNGGSRQGNGANAQQPSQQDNQTAQQPQTAEQNGQQSTPPNGGQGPQGMQQTSLKDLCEKLVTELNK